MMGIGRSIVSTVMAGLALAAMTAAGQAEELTWHMRSTYPYAVSVEFYSQDRSHVWPGNGKVYVIRDDDDHTYTLACQSGETICYGAWVRGHSSSYWGAGYGGDQACKACCHDCDGGETPMITLKR